LGFITFVGCPPLNFQGLHPWLGNAAPLGLHAVINAPLTHQRAFINPLKRLYKPFNMFLLTSLYALITFQHPQEPEISSEK